MRSDYEKSLIETFPELYKDDNANIKNSCMCWGFECMDGWMDIIWDLSYDITKLIKDDPDPPKVIQVKEKYGELCFYISYTTEEIDKLIEKAVERSRRTCEICGEKGEIVGTHWLECRCEYHQNKI